MALIDCGDEECGVENAYRGDMVDSVGPLRRQHGRFPFSCSFGSLLPSAAALSTTMDWRKLSLALNPG